MLVEAARAHMNEKYEWAQDSNNIIRNEGLYYRAYADPRPGSETDIPKLKHAFWSFLQAYQQVRFYHGAWLAQINRKGQGNKYMDSWKSIFLSSTESQSWDLLNKLRTEDTHNQPIIPDITVESIGSRELFSAFYTAYSSTSSSSGQQYQGVYGNKLVKINIADASHDLLPLTGLTLQLMRRFINTFDQIH